MRIGRVSSVFKTDSKFFMKKKYLKIAQQRDTSSSPTSSLTSELYETYTFLTLI